VLRRALLATSFALVALPAAAQSIRVMRTAEAADCPDDQTILASVAELRKTDRAVPDVGADVELAVVDGARHVATIRFAGPHPGTRTLAASEPGCAALARAVELSLAMMFDDEAEATPAPAPAPLPSSAPPPPPPKALRAGLPGHAEVVLSALVESALPTGPGIVVAPTLVFAPHDHVAIRLGGNIGTSHAVPFGPGEVAVQLLFASLETCLAFPDVSDPHVSACAAFAYGQLRGSGHRYTNDDSENRPYAALGGSVHAGGPAVGPLVWDVGLTGLGALAHESFSIDRLGPAYELPSFGLVAGAGFGVRFF
jgi:hypothetical protein